MSQSDSIEHSPAIVGGDTARRRRLWWGPLCLDLNHFAAHMNGRPLVLTRLEFDLLAYLMANTHRVVSGEELVRRVAKGVYNPQGSWIRVHVAHLRQKLGLEATIIETIRGRGLRLRVAPAPV